MYLTFSKIQWGHGHLFVQRTPRRRQPPEGAPGQTPNFRRAVQKRQRNQRVLCKFSNFSYRRLLQIWNKCSVVLVNWLKFAERRPGVCPTVLFRRWKWVLCRVQASSGRLALWRWPGQYTKDVRVQTRHRIILFHPVVLCAILYIIINLMSSSIALGNICLSPS